ncbi:TetR family transcriptional regulator C-terminal domain-containing protein [Streptomyces avidinii]
MGTSGLAASQSAYAVTRATTSAGSPPSGIERAHWSSGRRLSRVGYGPQTLAGLIVALDALPTPQDRLKALLAGWVGQREVTARYGCPTGTLASELDKRDDGPDQALANVMRVLLDWAEQQFRALGRTADARELAVALIASYQGISLLTNTFRDPELMTVEGARLERWIDSLAP